MLYLGLHVNRREKPKSGYLEELRAQKGARDRQREGTASAGKQAGARQDAVTDQPRYTEDNGES